MGWLSYSLRLNEGVRFVANVAFAMFSNTFKLLNLSILRYTYSEGTDIGIGGRRISG